jgi:ferric-dicitrate binding protein FerR (iron transport regulator)
LLEGAVHVSQGLSENILHPGQQAKVLTDQIKVQNIVNLDEVMSWKNDLFYFNGVDIKTIMRQVEKYYNVQVEFKDEINYQFVAKISRNVNISKFLETLEITELVHFKIENGKIIVTK